MNDAARVRAFLERGPYAVAGASRHRSKYGNKIVRALLRHGATVYAVNPNADAVEGVRAYPDLASLPEPVHGVSVITPPAITERVVEGLPACGAAWVWMQPGAESDPAIARAEGSGVGVIAGGPCLLVALGWFED